ncbi:MAG TPA: hypothetical protein VKA68_16315 [bacterium]|nr:hypothetical protein [bacterium]
MSIREAGEERRIVHESFILTVNERTGAISLRTSDEKLQVFANQTEILTGGPLLRVGRKPTLAERRQYLEKFHFDYWMPYLLEPDTLMQQRIVRQGESVVVTNSYVFRRPGHPRQAFSLLLDLTVYSGGWIQVDYQLTPQNAEDYFLELGLGFRLPWTMSEFAWIGDGPYASYPGKSVHAIRGLHHISADNPHFDGNRAGIDIGLLTETAGYGLGLTADGIDVSVERLENGIILTRNLRVAGKGTKPTGMITRHLVPAESVTSLEGSFRWYPLRKENWPSVFEDLFSDLQ